MRRTTIGYGSNCFLIGVPGLNGGVAVTTNRTAEIASPWRPIPTMTRLALQLVTEGDRRVFTANGTTDAVVGGTQTWTLANGAFATTDAGGFLVVRGTASNDGTYSIISRTSATVIVAGSAATDETFPATATFTVIPPGAIDGNWVVRVSNDYFDGRSIGELGAGGSQPVTTDTAHVTNVTTQLSPTINAVAHGTAASRNQFATWSPAGGRSFQVAFVPAAAGTGTGRVYALLSGVS